MNKGIVDLWADIGSQDYWDDLLMENPRVFVPFKERWPQPGFIGSNYLNLYRRVVVMGQNPRASNTAKASDADREMFRLIRHHSRTRSTDSLESLFAMMRSFMLGIDYKPSWRPITAVQGNLGLELGNIAYLNLIPLATYGDKIVHTAFKGAFCISTRLQLRLLDPHKVVVYGKGAYDEFQRIGLDQWDIRYIKQRDYGDAQNVMRWLDLPSSERHRENNAIMAKENKAIGTATTGDQTLLDGLTDAFPNQYIGKNSNDHRFLFAPGARIYVRKSNLNVARVLYTALGNFPNGGLLRNYVDSKGSEVRIHRTQTKVECLFDRRHLRMLIKLLGSS